MREKTNKRGNGYKKLSVLSLMVMLIGMGMSGCGDKEVANVYPESHRSSSIQEDEDYLYICGSCRISKIDKATGTEQILWENSTEVSEKRENLYSYGSGLLLGDKLYFIERWYDEDNWNIGRALSCINTDGSEYEQITWLSEAFCDSMYLADGTLTISDLDRELFYQVFEDGTLSAPDEIPINNQEQLYYGQNGERILFWQECMEEFGFRLLRNQGVNVAWENSDTGEQILVPELEGLKAYNDEYFLCMKYENGIQLVLTKQSAIEEKYVVEAGWEEQPYIEGKIIFTHDSFYSVLGMDEEYAYIVRSIYEEEGDTEPSHSYERISLETGVNEVIFVHEPSHIYFEPGNLMDEVILNDYIYYIEEQDYIYYLMRRKTDGSGEAERVCGGGVYDTGIGSVGTVKTYQEEIYSEAMPDRLLHEIDLKWIAVGDSYPGADVINTYLMEYQNTNIAMAKKNAAELEQWIIEGDFNAMSYSISSDFSGFSYYDSRYISFIQEEYEYLGGAHGMPYWAGFTFDLQTGERLLLSDITGISQEELKEVVSRYFAEMISQKPENFWEDAVDVVYETTNFESDFYLTEQGIVFYYGPYDLACYAAGFQKVTIPYYEFNMQITLEKAMN